MTEERRIKKRANWKAWYEANREAYCEKKSARMKAYYEANREKIAAKVKVWSKANREKCNACSRAYKKKKRQWREVIDFVSTINNINKLAKAVTNEEQRNESSNAAK